MTLRSALAAVIACVALTGCVTLLPKAEPSATYKLDIGAPAGVASDSSARFTLLRAPTAFPRVSAGDAIVTVSGSETASIAGARWAAPVQIMFDEAMVSAFDASSKVRLNTRGAVTAPDANLRVEVRAFEARYAEPAPILAQGKKPGPKDVDKRPAPMVLVEIKATLTYPSNSAMVAEQFFRSEVPADANRVSSIVDAYDHATASVLNDMVRWTESAPRPIKSAPLPASPR